MPITDRLKIPLLRYNVSLHKNCRTKPFHGTSRRTEQKGDRIGQSCRAIDELSALSRRGRPCVCRLGEPSAWQATRQTQGLPLRDECRNKWELLRVIIIGTVLF